MYRISHPTLFSAFLVGLIVSLFGLLSFLSPIIHGGSGVSLLGFVNTTYASCNGDSLYASDCVDTVIVNQCAANDSNCTTGIAAEELKGKLKDKVATGGTFTGYIQSIVVYLLGFVTLICVLLIIYQGGKIMVSGGNEETVKNAKKTIIYAFLGVILIFLAYSITVFVIGDKDGKGGIIQAGATSFRSSIERQIDGVLGIDTAQALQDAEIDEVISETFDEYSMYRFKRLMTKIFLEQNSTGVSPSTIQELTSLIDQSSLTLPDKSKTANDQKIAKIKVGLAKVLANPKSKDEASGLEGLIQGFSSSVEIGRISGEIGSSAESGNAPLTVTFRANNVKDPSGKKIPDGNYVWWIKGPRDEKIVIGRGVSFLYSFPLEKIYTVFLDVTSDSKNKNGKTDVLPLRLRTDINVLPRLANISFYLNGINVTNLNELKVTPGQARNGLVIDATASTSKDGAKFVSTEWDFGNGRSISYQGGPRLERQIYGREGDYNISLIVKNNSSEVARKTITLKVRDPIASIVASKTSGSLQDDFRFTTTTANSRLNLVYDWIISDRDGRDIARVKGGTLNYRFKKVGEYTIKLNATTVDNKVDTDFVVVTIDPRPPVVNFQLSQFSSEQPNVLRMNATQSIDPDTNSADQLKYRWKIDGQPRELVDTQRNGAIGVYKLSELGEHTVDLEVVSPNGLVATSTKKITIDSLLGADLKVAQKIVRVGDRMLFTANAPEAKIFVWNFGDGVTTNPVTDSTMTHIYNRSGIYTVRLTIRADNTGISNTISRVVYVGDSDTPVPLISISQGGEAVTPEVGVCGVGKEGYTISRLSSIDISARDSLNVDGTNQNLSYSWKANGKTSSLQTFPHSFDELGCFPIRLSVRSNQSGASAAREIWVKVDNIPPTLSGLSVTSADTTKDPVIVNVNAINAQDPDGVITSYIWSYWTKTDSEPQGLRVTRAPQTTFVLPRIDDTYYFGVILEDSNGVKSKSIDLLSQDATITLQSDNSNTPLITLKSSLAAPANTVLAGKQVTFTTSTTNLLDDNITDKTVFKWDFDGDGFYDKNANGSTATYTYQRPGIYRAKVKALYKGVSNTRTITITVTNDLKPSFDYIAIGRMIVLVNSTRGVYNNVTWELPDGAVSNELDSITIVLPEGQNQASITMRVSDGDKEVAATDTVNIDTRNIKTAASSNGIILLSQPRTINNSITIDSPDEKVTLYISSQGNVAKYAIDDNLNVDSNLNGDASDDEDNRNSPTYRNGGVYVVKGFNDRDASRTVRVTFYDSNNQKIDTKEIIIKSSFVSAVVANPEPTQEIMEIREQDRANLEILREMIQSKVPETSRATFMSYFGKLKDEWYDQNQKTTTIIEFEKAIASAGLDEKLVTEMNGILESFLATDDALGVEVSTALNTIRGLIPPSSSYAEEVMGKDGNGGLLKEILSAPNNLEENKVKALKILTYVKDDSQITVENKNILKSQLKVIIYHGSENIPPGEVEPSTEPSKESSSSGFMGTIIIIGQVIGILFGFVVVLILILLIFFKITNKNDAIGFQDWIIEKLFQHGHDDNLPSAPTKSIIPTPAAPVIKSEVITPKPSPEKSVSVSNTITTEATIDPLAQVSNTAGSQGLPESIPAPSETLPPWLKNAVEFNPNSTPASVTPADPLVPTSVVSEVVTPEVAVSNDPPEIPDWLKSISTPPVPETIVPSPTMAEVDTETSVVNESILPQVSSVEAPSSELPSWLMGTSDTTVSSDMPQAEIVEDIVPPTDASEDTMEIVPSEESSSSSSDAPIASSEMPAWLQDDVSVSKSESATEIASEQETTSFSLSPMDVSLGDTSSTTTSSQLPSDQQISEDATSDTSSETTTNVKPRKPRRKSKVQLQEEQGESGSDFSLNASNQITPDTNDPTANVSVPNSDLPEWLRS